MHLIERELDIEEAVEIRAVGHHVREVAAQGRHTKTRTVKNGVWFLLARKAEQHTANGPGAQSGLKLGHLAAIIGQGEDLDAKPEFARAALDSFVFPTADILGSPVLLVRRNWSPARSHPRLRRFRGGGDWPSAR